MSTAPCSSAMSLFGVVRLSHFEGGCVTISCSLLHFDLVSYWQDRKGMLRWHTFQVARLSQLAILDIAAADPSKVL